VPPSDMSIGALSAAAQVPVTTLRYYDRIGLLPAVRLVNNHRRYPESTLDRLQLIQLCRALGCSLTEVAAVLAPRPGRTRCDVARAKLTEIDGRMAQLRGARAVLEHLLNCEHGIEEAEECRQMTQAALAAAGGGTAAALDGPGTVKRVGPGRAGAAGVRVVPSATTRS